MCILPLPFTSYLITSPFFCALRSPSLYFLSHHPFASPPSDLFVLFLHHISRNLTNPRSPANRYSTTAATVSLLLCLSLPVFFTYSHTIILSTPFLSCFFPLHNHSSHFLAPSVAAQIYWMCLHLKQIPDSVFSATPIFPPRTFCTFTATLHLLFSSLRVASFLLWLTLVLPADLLPSTSHKSISPSLRTSHSSCDSHHSCPNCFSLPQPPKVPLLPPLEVRSHLKGVTIHPCSPLGETTLNMVEQFA